MSEQDLQKLIVRLEANDKQFARQMDRIESKTRRSMAQVDRSVSRTSRGFMRAGNALKLMLPAVSAALLVRRVRSITEELDEIGKTADNLGLTTDALQELRVVAESSGMQFDEFTKAFQKFTIGIGEAVDGSGTARDAFEKMGVSIEDARGNIKSSEQIFNEVSDALKGFTNESERASIAADLFGQRVGVKMLNLLRNGSSGMAQMREEARKLGVVVDEDLIRKAEESQTQLDLLANIIKAQMSTALINMAPLIVAVGNAFVFATEKIALGYDEMRKFLGLAATSNDMAILRASEDLAAAYDVRAEATDALAEAEERLARAPAAAIVGQEVEQARARVEAATVAVEELLDAKIALENAAFTLPELPSSIGGGNDDEGDSSNEEFDHLVEQLAERNRLLAQETELTGLSADAAARRRAELEASAAYEELMIAAMKSGNEVTEEERQIIEALVAQLEAEALALAEVEAAQRSATGSRADDIEVIEEQSDAIQDYGSDLEGLSNEIWSAIEGADSFTDALRGVIAALVKAALQASLLGQGPLAGIFGTSTSGGLFGIPARAIGGPVSAGSPYLVNENTPNSEIMVPSQSGAVLTVPQAQAALRGSAGSDGGSSTSMVYAPTIDARGASVEAVSRLEAIMSKERAQFEARVVKTIRTAQARRAL